MALSLMQKKAVVEEVAGIAKSAHSVVAADYRGSSVAQMTSLREKAKQSRVYLRVVRNTLARRAIEGTDFECMSDRLVGPLVLAFSQDEPAAAARVVRDCAKENDKLIIRFAAFDGTIIDASDIESLASLPTREELLGRFLGLLTAPVSAFVRTLAEPPAQVVRTVDAMRQKQAEG